MATSGGCVICLPIRKNLTILGEIDEDRPSLSSVSNEMIILLKTQLKIIKKALSEDDNIPRVETRLLALANTLAKVLESARKLQDDGISAVEQMSFNEKAEMFIEWISNLPPSFRLALRDKWDQWELQEAKPQMSLANGD